MDYRMEEFQGELLRVIWEGGLTIYLKFNGLKGFSVKLAFEKGEI